MQTVRRVPATGRRGASGLAGRVRAAAAALGAGALVLLGAAAPAAAAGETWYVDTANGADGSGCGVGPGASACATIGAALDHSAADDTIAIAAGTYFEALAVDSSITLEGSADVVLVSDGSGPALSAQGADVEVSVNGLSITPDAAGTWYAVVADGGSTVELSQVTIEHDPAAAEFGPGIRAQNHSSVVLTDSTVHAASSANQGADAVRGGIDAVNGSQLTITGSTISPAGDGDAAAFAGISLGEILADPGEASTLTMTASTVSAGGLANVAIFQGSATITDTSITASGPAPTVGGYGILIADGSLDLTGGEITGHPAGGIGNFGGSGPSGQVQVSVNGATIAENGTPDERQSGGIVLLRGPGSEGAVGSLDVTNADLIDNSTAIVTEGVPTTVTASAISGGTSGILTADADLSVTNSQLEGSTADAEQDDTGIWSANSGEEPVTLTVTGSDVSSYVNGVQVGAVAAAVSGSSIADNLRAGIMAQRTEQDGAPTAGTLTISDTEITGNGSEGFGPFGSGVLAVDGAVTATNVTIADNYTGMVIGSADVTLTGSSVTGSGADAPEEGPLVGVGILALGEAQGGEAPQLVVTGSEVSGNRGGLMLARPILVSSSTVAENTWFGIATEASSSTSGPLLTLVSSTIAGNGTTPMPGGEVPPSGLFIGPNAEVLVGGSVLDSPSATAACHIEDSGALTDGGYNVVSDDSCALTEESSLSGADPSLGELGDNGGLTNTMLPALDSPAVNLIPVGSTLPGAEVPLCADAGTDQRGITRPQGAACDAGAVELEYQAAQITTESLPDGIVGQSYSAMVEATGGAGEPYSWALTSGSLPPGLLLDAETGELSGEPTEAGTFEFTVQVDGETSATFSVTVLPELVIVTDTLPEATVGEPYAATLEATGGDGGPYTWGIDSGDLPDGLALNPETGEITGTPTAAESYTFTVVVGDPVYKEFTIEVVPAEAEETPPPDETNPPEETPPEETNPPEETPPPADDAPDEAGDETPEPEGVDSDEGELAVSGIDAPLGGLVLAGLALLIGALLLVLRRRLHLEA